MERANKELMGMLMEEYLARNSGCVNLKRHPELANLSDAEILRKYDELRNH